MPVIRFDHATGLCGGMLVVSSRNDPLLREAREKFGILPFGHELSQQLRVHAIDAQNDEFFPATSVRAAALARGEQHKREARKRSDHQPNEL